MEWVLTAMSKDRPGIVEDIAAIITKHDGNWVKSAMSRLGGQFAGIVQYTVAPERAEELAQELEALTAKNITISLAKDTQAQTEDEGEIAYIELTGIDHPGIVRDITNILREKDVTIEDLDTGVFTASMAGEPMFYASAKIRLPAGLSLTDLRRAAETAADDLMVDINLEIDEIEN